MTRPSAPALLLPLLIAACSPGPTPTGPLAPAAPPPPATTTSAPSPPLAPTTAPSVEAAPPAAPPPEPPRPAHVLWAIEPVDNTDGYRLLALPGAPLVVAGENQGLVTSPDDMFIEALAEDGAVLWHKSGTAKWLRALSGAQDHLYVGTEFTGKLDFQGVRASTASTAVLVAKLDASGALAWGRTLGTPDYTRLADVAATPDGGVAAAIGIFLPAKEGALAVPVAGSQDAVVVNYDAAGAVAWVKTFGWPGYDEATGIVAGAGGDVIVGGTRWKSPDTWAMALADGRCHGWIAKLGPGGEQRWLVDLGEDTTRVTVSRVIQGNDGAIVVAGVVRWRNRIGTIELDGGSKDRGYLAGIDPGGHVQWARLRDVPSCFAVDPEGRLVVAGPGGVSVETPSGESVSVLAFGPGAVERVEACRLDGAGHLYVSGVAQPGAKIGDKSVSGPVLKRPRTSWLHRYEVGFVAKIAL